MGFWQVKKFEPQDKDYGLFKLSLDLITGLPICWSLDERSISSSRLRAERQRLQDSFLRDWKDDFNFARISFENIEYQYEMRTPKID